MSIVQATYQKVRSGQSSQSHQKCHSFSATYVSLLNPGLLFFKHGEPSQQLPSSWWLSVGATSSLVVNVCVFVRGAGVAGACGRHDGRRGGCTTAAAAVVVDVGGGWYDGAARQREGSADSAAARPRPACSQVSAT